MKIKLTKLQRDELRHKLDIMESEEDLLESYEVTADEVRDIARRVALPVTELTDDEAGVLAGEVENLLEIAQSNMDTADDAARRQLAAYMGSMRGLLNKLQTTTEKPA